MSSFKRWIPFIGIILLLFLLIGGCSRSGSLKPNQPPVITITSYGGTDSLSNKLEPFQQKIYWEAHDVDGVVKYYAYRVLDKDNNPIQTSGHPYIDSEGWVYHYKEGVTIDENTPPPNTPGYGTIWTKDLYALINFPACDSLHDSTNVASIFEVKCKDNRGAESEPARKYFYVHSNKPKAVYSMKTKINGETIGQGIALELSISDFDIGLEEGDKADHFEIMLKKKSAITGEFIKTDQQIEDGYYEWHNVYKNSMNKYYVEISKNSIPKLEINTYNQIYDTFEDSTIILYRVMDIAGIYSETDSVTVAVKTGYHPGTIIYYNTATDVCFALGKYHYSVFNILPSESKINVPSFKDASGNNFYALPLFSDLQGNKVVIGSDDLKIFMRWGWKGEYTNDDPSQKKNLAVLDENTGNNYFSKIKAFLVRLDNKPLYLPYLPVEGDNLYIDSNGKKWLKISSSNSNFQNAILTKTTLEYSTGNFYGVHKLEVSAIDLQGIADPTPAIYEFNIQRFIPPEEREGILVLDNDSNNNIANSNYTKIDSIYRDLLSDFPGDIEFKDTTLPDYVTNISLTDYLKYKFIIFHSEILNQATEDTKLKRIFLTFQLYLDFGGNLMITGGKNLEDDFNKLNNDSFENLYKLFENYFGITMPGPYNNVSDGVTIYTDNNGRSFGFMLRDLKYFIGATTNELIDFPNIDFDYDTSKNIEPKIGINMYNPLKALGPVSYIEAPTANATPIYYFKSIPPGDTPQQPTETEYQLFNNFVVGQKKITDKNKCYIFTFPLSYMKFEQAKELMNKIINEVMGQ